MLSAQMAFLTYSNPNNSHQHSVRNMSESRKHQQWPGQQATDHCVFVHMLTTLILPHFVSTMGSQSFYAENWLTPHIDHIIKSKRFLCSFSSIVLWNLYRHSLHRLHIANKINKNVLKMKWRKQRRKKIDSEKGIKRSSYIDPSLKKTLLSGFAMNIAANNWHYPLECVNSSRIEVEQKIAMYCVRHKIIYLLLHCLCLCVWCACNKCEW